MPSDNFSLVIIAVLGSIGPTIAVIVGAIINYFGTKRAQEAAIQAQIATAIAAENAAKAQTAAAEAARLLVVAARNTDSRLQKIITAGNENMEVTEQTHKIVNSQRTIMLRMVASLARRIAKENPTDKAAQVAAEQAESDLTL